MMEDENWMITIPDVAGSCCGLRYVDYKSRELFISFIVSGLYNLATEQKFDVIDSLEYMIQIGGIRVLLRLFYFIMLEVISHNRFIHQDGKEDKIVKGINVWKWNRSDDDPVTEDSKDSVETV